MLKSLQRNFLAITFVFYTLGIFKTNYRILLLEIFVNRNIYLIEKIVNLVLKWICPSKVIFGNVIRYYQLTNIKQVKTCIFVVFQEELVLFYCYGKDTVRLYLKLENCTLCFTKLAGEHLDYIQFFCSHYDCIFKQFYLYVFRLCQKQHLIGDFLGYFICAWISF